jgi:hypothetical protein
MAHGTNLNVSYSTVGSNANRSVMNGATPFAASKERRHMIRITAFCPPLVC